jgi:fatty acid CoA ligase FadD9
MEPHRHDEDLLKRALDRCRRLVENDEQLQRLAPSSAARARIAAEGTSSIRCLALACEVYADRPCLGERLLLAEGGELRPSPALRFLSYAELWARVQAVAAGLHDLGLARSGALVGLCGFGSIDWVVADLACLYLAAVSVPLQTTAGAAEVGRIVAEAALSSVVTSLEQLPLVVAAIAAAPSVQSVIVMDLREDDRAAMASFTLTRKKLEEEQAGRLRILTLTEVERAGRSRGPVPFVEPAADALVSIVYTSGSTGSPKGAMFPERIWVQDWHSGMMRAQVPTIPRVSVNYMPLNHMAGRGGMISSLMEGGATSFVLRSDMSTLFEDIAIARPTTLFLVPRASSMIHQVYQTEVIRRAALSSEPRWTIEAEVREEMRATFLGDRMIYAVAGAAPTAPEVFSFLERCFEMPVYDGFGSTEAGMVALDGHLSGENLLATKLTDVPELGYLGTDRPHPRGELCVKTRRMIPGYYKNPAATRDLFDAEGYVLTGDIVEMHGADDLVWIDRKKNVLKLAQGEFVSISRLEEIYTAGSALLRQVYLYGNSVRSYLLAVLVPQQGGEPGAGSHPGERPGALPDIKRTLRGEIERIAAREGLRGYEVPRDFLIETEPFSQENALLTESNKPARARLRARYGERLEALYTSIEQRQLEELARLESDRGRGGSVAEKVAQALAITVGLPELDVEGAQESFLQLGGDSLGAVRLASLLESVCGVAVPVGLLLDPTMSVPALVRYVEERISGAAPLRAATFEQVHGAGATTVRADDLRLDRFLTPRELEVSRGRLSAAAKAVLLTGANGFLGRFLLLALAERLPREGGKVVAVVRAPTDAAALARLGEAYGEADPSLPQRFAALVAEGRVEVLAGDLIKPRLGIADARWDQLCDELDAVIHNGALVNHALSYVQLFEPNVLGTVEAIRLALGHRLKSLAFVSTVGVAAGLDRRKPVREDEDARALGPSRPIDSGYAVGYSTSKWAGELLAGDLAERFGAPVSVFRCSMILPPRGAAAQVNTGDFLTRLLYGVVLTGVAPRSFYATPGKHHFDGFPVDFVASSIAAIALERQAGRATYHLVPENGGVSLDTLMDWIQSAGYTVKRIDDYARWYRTFQERLEALPAAQKHASPLPTIYQWERPIRGEVSFDARRLRERLAALAPPGGAVEMPRIDEAFVHKYLRDMVALGLIDRPKAAAA